MTERRLILLQSATVRPANARQVLVNSAARWTTRAELLDRVGRGAEARLAAPLLTAREASEDAAFARRSFPSTRGR